MVTKVIIKIRIVFKIIDRNDDGEKSLVILFLQAEQYPLLWFILQNKQSIDAGASRPHMG